VPLWSLEGSGVGRRVWMVGLWWVWGGCGSDCWFWAWPAGGLSSGGVCGVLVWRPGGGALVGGGLFGWTRDLCNRCSDLLNRSAQSEKALLQRSVVSRTEGRP